MNSKIKIIFFNILIALSLLQAPVSKADLTVCGPSDAQVADYQNWLTRNQIISTGKDTGVDYTKNPDQWYKDSQAVAAKDHICQPSDIFKLLAKVTNYLIIFAGTFFLVRLVFAGYIMVGFPGNENAIGEARSKVTNALIGMLLVFAAYVIINEVFNLFGVSQQGIFFGKNLFGG